MSSIKNMAAYGTAATSALLASDALLFVAPQLQRYKRSRSLVPATGAPYFDAPQIVELGRLGTVSLASDALLFVALRTRSWKGALNGE